MTNETRARVGAYLAELPGALRLSVLTAIVTLALAVALSLVLGSENSDHRLELRCFERHTQQLLHEMVLADPALRDAIDLSQYPPINVNGIDCERFLEEAE